jgi:O-antigen ligase
MISRNFFFLELLLLLIPIFLVFSRAISEFFFIIITVFFLVYTIKNRITHYYKNKFFIFFIIFCIYLVFISLFKINTVPSAVLFFFRFGLYSLAIWFLLENNNKLLKSILLSILITCSVVFFDAFIQYLFNYNLLGYKFNILSQPRLSGFFKDELILGSYLSRFSPMFLLQFLLLNYDFKIKNFFQNKFFFSLIIFILTFVILATGERTALIFYFLSICFFCIFLSKTKRILSIIFIFIIACTLLYLKGNSRLYSATYLQISQSFDSSGKLQSIDKIPVGHLQHWNSAYLMIQKNFYFGIGPRMFKVECHNKKYKVINGCSTHPHNLYFQLFAEAGVFAFLALLFLFGIIFIKLAKAIFIKINNNFKNKNNDLYLIYYFSIFCLFIHLIPILPNGDFFNNWINMTIVLPIAIILYTSSIINKEND